MNQLPAVQSRPAAVVGGHPFEPRNIEEALKLAGTLADSGLVPSALRGKPSDVLVVMMKGRELGLGAMAALGSIHVIEGKATLSADLIVGLILKSGKCEYFTLVESTREKATYRTKRKDSPHEVQLTFTIDDARQAGLLGKSNWKAWTPDMLCARCSSRLGREVYPDVAAGLYEEDEGDEIRGGTTGNHPKALAQEETRPRTVDALKAELSAKLQPGMAKVIDVAKSTPPPKQAEPAQELDVDPFADLPSTQAEPIQPQTALEFEEECLKNPMRWLAFITPSSVEHRLKLGARMGETWGAWDEWSGKSWWKGKAAKYTPDVAVLGGKGGGRHSIMQAVVKFAEDKIKGGSSVDTLGAGAVVADYCLAMMEERYERMEALGLDPTVSGDAQEGGE